MCSHALALQAEAQHAAHLTTLQLLVPESTRNEAQSTVKLVMENNKTKPKEHMKTIWVRYGGGSTPNTWRPVKPLGWAGTRFENIKVWNVEKNVEQIWYLDLVGEANFNKPTKS